jgi:hypothetical protein
VRAAALQRRQARRRRSEVPAVLRCIIREAPSAAPARAGGADAGYFSVRGPVATLAPPATPPGTATRTSLPPPGAQASPPPGAQASAHGPRDMVVIPARALASWLAAVRLRLGDHVFAMNDSEASWRHWQVTKVRGGLGRHYRDPLFDGLRY